MDRSDVPQIYTNRNTMPTWITFILITAALTAVVGLLVWLGSRAMRGARRGTPGVSSLGWALLFLSSGRMPPPPPDSQIEQEMQTRKDRLASQQDEDP